HLMRQFVAAADDDDFVQVASLRQAGIAAPPVGVDHTAGYHGLPDEGNEAISRHQGNRTSISLDSGIGCCPIRTASGLPLGVRNSPGRVRWIGLRQLGKDWMTQGPATPVCMISTSC